MKRNNKNKGQKRSNNKQVLLQAKTNKLYKVINPIVQRTRATIIDNLVIVSNDASPAITFGSSQKYYNLSSLGANSDFSNTADGFLYFQIKAISIDIMRTASEDAMMTNLRGNDNYLGFYPELQSTTISYSDLVKDVNSYRIEPMTFDPQLVVVKIPDFTILNTSGGVDYWLNIGRITEVRYASLIPGQIAINCENSTNNTGTTNLFKVRIRYHCTFYHRK